MTARVASVGLLVLAAGCGAASPAMEYGECTPELRGADADRCVGELTEQTLTAAFGIYEDARLTDYVGAVGERVARVSDRSGVDYRFVILDAPEPQAWAAPGGRIFITRGLMARLGSEAELAGVLAHEVGHVAAGHVDHLLDDLNAPRWDDAVALTRALAHERDQERQADQLAVLYLRWAGYDPGAATEMLEATYRGEEDTRGWADRHPPLPVRLALVARAAGADRSGERAEARYLEHLEGMVVGHDPRFGTLRGRRYVHARAGIGFAVPEGWEAPEVMAQAYGLRDPEEALVVGFIRLGRAGELFPERSLRRDLEGHGVAPLRLAGHEGISGWLPEGQASRVHLATPLSVSRVALFTGRDGAAYALFVGARDDERDVVERLYARVTSSFSSFDRAIEPRRLRLRRVERPSSLEALEGCAAEADHELWSVMNGMATDATIGAGRVVKCVAR